LIRASPGLQSGEADFQTREYALSCNDRALAMVRMPQAPQSTRFRDLDDSRTSRASSIRSHGSQPTII
jgi:hypothetical protein